MKFFIIRYIHLFYKIKKIIIFYSAIQIYSKIILLRKLYISFLPSIRHICLLLTFKCNLKCDFCDLWREENNSLMDLNKLKTILSPDKFRPKHIELSGGEPFCHDYISDVYNYLISSFPKIKISITTNGTLTSKIEKFLNKIKNYDNLVITISVYGFKSSNEDLSTSNINLVEKTLLLLNEKFPSVKKILKIMIDKPSSNLYNKLIEFYNFSKINKCQFQLKFRELAKYYNNNLSSENDFEKISKIRKYSDQEKKEIILAIQKFIKTLMDFKIVSLSNIVFINETLKTFKNKKYKTLCVAPGNYIMIYPDLKAYPCRYINYFFYFDSPTPKPKEIKILFEKNNNCPLPKQGCLCFWNFYV